MSALRVEFFRFRKDVKPGAASFRAELERDRDALMERYAEMVPEALDALGSEERHRLYKMLRLKVVSNADSSLEVTGVLSDQFCGLETVSR